MSRVLIYGLMALSLGLSGCQATKMQSTPVTPAASGMVNAFPQSPGALPPAVMPGGDLPGRPRPNGNDPRDPVLVGPPVGVEPLPLPLDPDGDPTGGTVPVRPRPTGNDPRDPRPVPPTYTVPPTKTTVDTNPNPLVPNTNPPRQTIVPNTPRPEYIPPNNTGPLPPGPTAGVNPGPNGGLIPRGTGGLIPGRTSQIPVLETTRERVVRNNILPPGRPTEFGAVARNGARNRVTPAGATGDLELQSFPVREATCEERPVRVEKQSQKVSFVFVVDTSASLVKAGKGTRAQGELTQIAHGMPNFINKLPRDLDYRIGVVLAHGPQSTHFGRLYSAGAGDRVVLSNRDMKLRGKVVPAMRPESIVTALENKMMTVPDDKSAAQGEALNLGLFELTSNHVKVEAARDAGLFAPGRDVIVVEVTDEQDVCFNYEGSGFTPVFKPNPPNGKLGPDIHETKFFNQVCRTFLARNVKGYVPRADSNHIFSHEDVVQALKGLETSLRAKVIMQAIAYVSPQPPVSYKEDDKEMAHGIIELVQGMNSGTIADMANVDHSGNSTFANELTLLGESANFQMSYSSSFDCRSDINPDAINKRKIVLEIGDGGGRPLRYSTECELNRPCQNADGALAWKVEGTGAKRGLRVFPADQNKFAEELSRANMRKPMQKIRVETIENVDTKTGKKNDGSKIKGPTSHGPIPRAAMTPVVGVPASLAAPTPAPAKTTVPPKAPVAPKAPKAVPTTTPPTGKQTKAVTPAPNTKATAAPAAPASRAAAPASKAPKAEAAPAPNAKNKVDQKDSKNAPATQAKAPPTKPTKKGLPSDVDGKK